VAVATAKPAHSLVDIILLRDRILLQMNQDT